TARAKGLTENVIMLKHVLRNAMIPILTNVAVALPGIFVGSFLIEVFFSIPGLGREILLAVNSGADATLGRRLVGGSATLPQRPGRRRLARRRRALHPPRRRGRRRSGCAR